MRSRNPKERTTKRFKGAGAPENQTGLRSFASHLLRSGGLLSLFQIAVRFGLFLCCVLVCCFWGLVAHGILPFV